MASASQGETVEVTPSPVPTAKEVLEAGKAVLAEAEDVETLTRKEIRKLVAARLNVDAKVIKGSKDLEGALRRAVDLLTADDDKDAPAKEVEEPKEGPQSDNPEEEESSEGALLRGRLTIVDGGATWTGHWAFSKEDWRNSKKKHKFKLTAGKFSLEDESPQKFKGWFKYGTEGKSEKDVASLAFVKTNGETYKVSGRGENRFGPWSLAMGVYDHDKHKLSATRVYDGATSLAALASSKDLPDDDDDDDYKAPENEVEDTGALDEKAFVRLRGTFVQENDTVSWTGVWADAGLDVSDDLPKFQYTGTKKRNVAKLDGHFEWKAPTSEDDAPREDVKEPMTLRFDNDKVIGGGSNSFGSFDVRGTFDPKTKILYCQKKFKPPQKDDSDDDLDDEDDDDVRREVAELAEEAEEANRAARGSRDNFDKEQRRRAAGDDLKARRYVSSCRLEAGERTLLPRGAVTLRLDPAESNALLLLFVLFVAVGSCRFPRPHTGRGEVCELNIVGAKVRRDQRTSRPYLGTRRSSSVPSTPVTRPPSPTSSPPSPPSSLQLIPSPRAGSGRPSTRLKRPPQRHPSPTLTLNSSPTPSLLSGRPSS